MRRTAILRFGDAERSTLEQHRSVIQTSGATWWGWWKKKTEAFAEPILNHLSKDCERGPLYVGLVNRKDEQYAGAVCEEIRFNCDGIASPEANLTPEYYRAQPFPAWFKFSKIDVLSKTQFRTQFCDVPSSDPTLYQLTFKDDGERELEPREEWSMAPIVTSGETVLHLSDLHFGPEYGFPLEYAHGQDVDRLRLPELLTNRIFDLGLKVAVVVVSGDLITKGDANQYPKVASFLDELLKALELEREHCVIVPGNHDLWTGNIDHPTRDYGHEAGYKQFVGDFFTEKFRELERPRRYRLNDHDDLVFIELNSARIRSDALKEYGYISKHRYEKLLDWVTSTLKGDPSPSGRTILFAVLHHHLLPVWAVSIPDKDRPVSLCLDAGELIDQFQRFGVRFVLHGHQHFPFIGAVCRAPTGTDIKWEREKEAVFVLGCGSSGVSGARLPHGDERGVYGNICGLYTLTEDEWDVRFEQYNDRVTPQTLWRTMIPVVA